MGIIESQTSLYRTMRRSIVNALGNEEAADRAMDSIIDAHPHLADVWERGTCKICRGILSELERIQPHGCCEFCEWQADHDVYAENLRRYGAE